MYSILQIYSSWKNYDFHFPLITAFYIHYMARDSIFLDTHIYKVYTFCAFGGHKLKHIEGHVQSKSLSKYTIYLFNLCFWFSVIVFLYI